MADITKVKGNIRKLIAAGAEEADIDEYIASEGVTLDALKAGASIDLAMRQEPSSAIPQLGVASAPPTDELSWSEVPVKAVSNAPKSAARLFSNIAQTVLHPIDTAKGLGNIAYGVGSKVGGALGVDQDPSRKLANEASADAVGEFFKNRYGSSAGIKNTLAEDPVGAMADLSLVLTGGGAIAARAPSVVGSVGRAAQRVGSAVDPLANAGRAIGFAGRRIADAQGLSTGAGSLPLIEAYSAGKTANPVFLDHIRGIAPASDALEMAKSAMSSIRSDRGAAYKAGMQNVPGSGTLLNFKPITRSLSAASDKINYHGVAKSQEAADTLAAISSKVDEFQNIPSSSYRTPQGLDALKQAIGEIRQSTKPGTLSRNVADDVYNTIKAQIVKQVPEYAKTMKGYSQASEQIDDLTKTFSLGDKASKDTAIRKLTSVMRNNVNTNYGERTRLLKDVIAKKQPDLMPAIAGQALSSTTPRGLQGVLANGLSMGGFGSLAAFGNPALLAALPFMSPKVMGLTNYGVGRAVGTAQDIGRGAANLTGISPGAFGKGLAAAYAAGQITSPLRGGIGPDYDEYGNRKQGAFK